MPAPSHLQRYYLGLLIAICLGAAYIALIVYTDNTNLGTTNGLWKAPSVSAWEQGSARPEDDGELIYLPAYGYLSRLIPDRWMRYGTYGSVVVFRKMAILDGIFGAIASAIVFFLAFRFTQSALASLVLCLVHASSGFVLLNSLNSEDIIPGYACFLAGSASLFEYVATRQVFWIVLSGSFLALTTLLHWSLMGPGLIALGVVLCLMAIQNPRRLWALALFGVTFLAVIQAILLFGRHVTVLEIIYPRKLSAIGGWAGFHPEKLIYALIGIGNYFSGAQNLSDYHFAFSNPAILKPMIVSWVYTIITLVACVWVLIGKRASLNLKLFAAFAWILFLVGELPDLYGQPQDPQMQIQPMFATTAGLIILMSGLLQRLGRNMYRLVVAGVFAVAVCNAAWNIHTMERTRGADSQAVGVTEALARLFPPNNTVMVWHGFEGWLSWQYVITFHGDSLAFLSRSVHLASAFTNNPGITGEAAADLMKKRIDAALARGDRVVAQPLWTQTRTEFLYTLTTVTSGDNAGVYYDRLHDAYELGQRWQTGVGTFVELRRKGPASTAITPQFTALSRPRVSASR